MTAKERIKSVVQLRCIQDLLKNDPELGDLNTIANIVEVLNEMLHRAETEIVDTRNDIGNMNLIMKRLGLIE